MKFKNFIKTTFATIAIFIVAVLFNYFFDFVDFGKNESNIKIEEIPSYTGSAYIEINNNQPDFSEEELEANSFEEYSPLDSLGRVGTATAMVGTDLMPKQKRGSISEVKPTGWIQADYDFVEGKKLYNRCVRL